MSPVTTIVYSNVFPTFTFIPVPRTLSSLNVFPSLSINTKVCFVVTFFLNCATVVSGTILEMSFSCSFISYFSDLISSFSSISSFICTPISISESFDIITPYPPLAVIPFIFTVVLVFSVIVSFTLNLTLNIAPASVT